MQEMPLVRWPDLLVISINLGIMVAIGIYCARKAHSADAYFLANRRMPGWVVAFSIMATLISSMTFLAIPGYTFANDWRFVPSHVLYVIPAAVAYFIFMPFFRRGNVRTAYEYLERRFGTWARIYGAVAFLFFHMFRTGIILYVVSLAVQTMTNFDMPEVICILGVLVAIYTIAGGLEAVIYTDFLQGVALIIGGLICTPIMAYLIADGDGVMAGMSQIFNEASTSGKFSLGSTALNLKEKTVWVIILTYQFQFLQIVCTDQSMVQRYLAMKTDAEARRGFILSTFLTVPVWIYFSFIGTALFVYYNHFPEPNIVNAEPEAVFPYFILTQVPAGVSGFVIAGLLAAAMSTLDSSINASAATVTTDFYRRFRPQAGDERHYLRVGRWASVLFGMIMIGIALMIHYSRTETLMEIQTVVYPVVSAGMLSLFLLGFLTVRVGSRAAAIATTATVLLVGTWTILITEFGKEQFPYLASLLPNQFWIGVLPHLFLILVAYLASFLLPRRAATGLENLTIWTSESRKQ